MAEEALIEPGDFAAEGGDGYYSHFCRKRGSTVLHREQMGFYRVSHYQIVNGKSDTWHWEIDTPPGCLHCGGLPEDLREVYLKHIADEERKKQNRIKDKKRKKSEG